MLPPVQTNKGVILSEAKDLPLNSSAPPDPPQTPTRFLAIDWSGALDRGAQRRGIWVADCRLSDPELSDLKPGDPKLGEQDHAGAPHPVTLRSGENRAAIEGFLLLAATETPALVAGLDFSFSYPEAFLDQLGCADAPAFWERVAEDGESWLAADAAARQPPAPHAHFWGRGKVSRPAGHLAPSWFGYRQTELAAVSSGRLPRSSFQIGGAGAVGTGSLRGIPMLARLRRAGYHVWPFDPPRLPLLVEIYPRLLTGPVVKSSREARAAYLARPAYASLPAAALAAALASEDAFDALLSAWRMREHAAAWPTLPWPPDARTRREGAIWRPDL